MLQQSSLDRVFQALADPTRRAMVEKLGRGPSTVSALAEPFDVSLSAIGQHLRLLEDSGIVRSAKAGRVRTVELVPDGLTSAERWFTRHRERWEKRLDRLGELLDEDDDQGAKKRRT
jgi:DNA-binding transcriptional ArsR family regulator